MAVFSDEEWRSFCSVIGKPPWCGDPRFADLPARKANEDELDKLIEEWTTRHTAEDVMTLMQAAGVAAGVIETIQDLMDTDARLISRNLYWSLEHPEAGVYRAPRPQFIMSESPCELRRAPLIGEHNEFVLKTILGLLEEEIAELVVEDILN